MSAGAEKLALAALVVAILLVPIALYSAMNIGSIAAQQEKSNKEIADKIAELGEQLNQSTQQTSQTLEDVKQRLQTLETNLTLLKSNITGLMTALADLQAQVSLLSQKLAQTNQSLREDLSSINETIARLQQQLRSLQERASLLFPATIIDGTGDEVVIPERPERIVSLAPSVSEMLYFVNATDRIVGVDRFTDWPPELVQRVANGTVEVIGGFSDPDIEKILALQPDLVVGVADVPSHVQVKEILKAYGIPVILLPQASVDDIKNGLIILGRATGNIAEATRAAADFESKIVRISLAGQGVDEKRSVAIIVWVGNPMYVVGNGTFQGSGIEIVGAVNAFGSLAGWPAVSPEELLAAAPDVIVLTGINLSDFYSFVNDTLGPDAQNIPAIANDRVYSLSYDVSSLLNRPSPRFAQGLLVLQYIVYPEIYGYNVTDVPHTITSIPEGLNYPQP